MSYLFLLVLSLGLASPPAARPDTALFAGGCFWSMERPFQHVPGVLSTTVGFAGGTVESPSYVQVSTGNTGHAETVRVIFNPSRVSYARLLDVYWRNIDPFTANAQFCDHGNEYRTIVFYNTPSQKEAALGSKRWVEARFHRSVSTSVESATPFYPAEEYHQHFADRNPARYDLYRLGCRRDATLRSIWGKDAAPFVPPH